VQAGGVLDQQLPAGGEDGVVGGVPRRTQPLSDAGDRESVDDHRLQRPQHRRPAQLRPRCRRRARVLTPHVPAASTAVAADRDVQDRRPPPHRDVRQPAQHGVPGSSLDTAATAPAVALEGVIRLEDPARQHRVVLADELAGDGQPHPVGQAERIEIRTVESRLSHVEVFQMGSVRTSIIGGPRPSPPHRRANPRYTLECEEPQNPPIHTLKRNSRDGPTCGSTCGNADLRRSLSPVLV